MPKYAVRIEGQNFHLKLNGEEGCYGFYTTRVVKSHSVDQAKSSALSNVRADPELSKLAGSAEDDQSSITVDEVWRVQWWRRLGGKGFTFYGM